MVFSFCRATWSSTSSGKTEEGSRPMGNGAHARQNKGQWKALLFPYGKSSNLFMCMKLSWYQFLLNAPPLLTAFTMVTMPLHKLEFLPSFFWYGKPYHNHSRRSGEMALCGSEWLLWNHKGFSWNPSTPIKLGWFPAYSEPQDLPGAKTGLLWLEGNKPGWNTHAQDSDRDPDSDK